MESSLAFNILSSINTTKKKSFASYFSSASDDCQDLIRKLLEFNPRKRLTVEEALKHPYVSDFHNEEEETVCEGVIKIGMNDNTKFSIKEYREALYNDIYKRLKDKH